MHAALLGIARRERREHAMQALKTTGILEYANTPIGKLSKGLTQRVGIAQALVGNPRLLILDEPASGLDPIGRRNIRDLLSSLRKSGLTIFLSSHLLSEIETVCDRVAILNRGKLVAAGTPDSIKKCDPMLAVTTPELPVDAELMVSRIANRVEKIDGESLIYVDTEQIFAVMRLLEQYKIPPTSVSPARESLEDAFLRLAV
jgi:ABC-2 type transport system ATP-binding protein